MDEETENEDTRTRPPRTDRLVHMISALQHGSLHGRWLVGVLVFAICLKPGAGFLLSDGLITQCFGLDRPTRTASSCSLIMSRNQNSEELCTFYTHDERAVTITDTQYAQQHPATFTFYTYDGRAVTRMDPFPSSMSRHQWDAIKIVHGSDGSCDLASSILRSRYPLARYSSSPLCRPARLMPPANRQEVGGLQWLALNGRDLEEGSNSSWGRSKQFILDEKAVDAARAQFERIWKEQERAVVATCTAAYTTRMQQLAQRSAAARKYNVVRTLHSDSIFTHKPREYIIQCFSQKSIITLRLRGGSTLQRSSNVTANGECGGVAAGVEVGAIAASEGPAPPPLPALAPRPPLAVPLAISSGLVAAASMKPTPPIGKARNLLRVSSRAVDGGMPLRIALLTWESLHTIAVGGVAPHVTELAAGLERRGHEVHVYSRTGDGQMPYEIIDGVHIHRVPIALDPDFITECGNMCNSFCWFLSESETFQGAKFDICHGHDWLAAKALVQCKNMGRNTVATIHSTEYGRCGNVNYGGQSERIRRIEEEVVVASDRVISVSGVLCDEVKQQFRVSEHKLRMVYNGIHLAPYLTTVDAGSVKARYNMGPLDPLVLFVGRLATQKGPDLLVEAVPLVLLSRADVKFAIVGDGYMRADLERRVQELGVQSAVRFLGSMSGLPLVQLFKSADCVCIPSRNEPFGIVVLEAWASGKPVVATSSGGPREFVDHGVDGFHVHPSANSISWGICEIFSNFENARLMGVRGRAKAQNKFNWDKIAEETERIYRELAGF